MEMFDSKGNATNEVAQCYLVFIKDENNLYYFRRENAEIGYTTEGLTEGAGAYMWDDDSGRWIFIPQIFVKLMG